MEALLTYIRTLTEFSDESWTQLQKALSRMNYRKNEFLLREGQTADTLFYIEKGYCRSYREIEGIEKNTNFFFEDEIAASPSDTSSNEKSRCNIVACEPLTVIRLHKDILIAIAHDAVEIERMGRHFIRAFAAKQVEFSDLIKLYAAAERLDYIEKKHAKMLQRVPLSQLASFLGVTREALSRIRKQRSQGGNL